MDLVISRGSEVLMVFPVEQGTVRIGRAPGNDLILPLPSVSRRQCEIRIGGEGPVLRDLSGNGTTVDGKAVQEARLGPDSRVRLGDLEVTAQRIQEDILSASTAARVGGGDTAPIGAEAEKPRRLKICVGQKEYNLSSNMTVGRHFENDLVLENPSVSSFHARFLLRGSSWLVEDLDSKNGTFVNGVRVKLAELSPGQVIQMGNQELLVREQSVGTQKYPGRFGIVTEDPAMEPVLDLVEKAAREDATVLVLGESGTGKELIARAIHGLSKRSPRPLVAFNCSDLTSTLAGSELFGHQKGAFTGALQRHRGLFEEADGGTLFLDEIGDLPAEIQSRMLRTLDSGEIRPVGSNQVKNVNVRVIAATNRPLKKMVEEGSFREDLYYRLDVLRIEIPPLRERPKDVRLLARYFLEKYTGSLRGKKEISDHALNMLAKYYFPGNVRQLANMIQKAAITSNQSIIDVNDLDLDGDGAGEPTEVGQTLKDRMAGEERKVIKEAVEACGGNLRLAATRLNVPLSTLKDKVRKFGIGGKE